MSSAKKAKGKFVLCSHINKFSFGFFHRAKPVTEVERSGTEVHCGPAGSGTEVPNGPAGGGQRPSNQQRRCDGTDTNSNFLLLLRRTCAGSYRIWRCSNHHDFSSAYTKYDGGPGT